MVLKRVFPLLLALLLLSPSLWAEQTFKGKIITDGKRTIKVESLSSGAFAEGYVVDAKGTSEKKKTRFPISDIKKIERNFKESVHVLTLNKGGEVKLKWFAFMSTDRSVRLEFKGTYEDDGSDADGSISGSNINQFDIEAGPAPVAPVKADVPVSAPVEPKVDAPVADAPKPDAVKPDEAKPEPKGDEVKAEPKADEPKAEPKADEKPGRDTKRLSSAYIDNQAEEAKVVEERLPKLIAKYEEAKKAGKLLDGDVDNMVIMDIHQSIRNLIQRPIDYLQSNIDEGWRMDDKEMKDSVAGMRRAFALLPKADFWQAFSLDDKPFLLEYGMMEKVRNQAFAASLMAKAGKNLNKVQEMLEWVDKEIAKALSYSKQKETISEKRSSPFNLVSEGLETHPGFARFKTEIDRLKAECADALKGAQGKKEETLKAWKELIALSGKHQPLFNKLDGNIHPNDFATLIDEIEAFEKNEAAVLRQKLEAFAKIHGNEQEKMNNSVRDLMGKDMPTDLTDAGYIYKNMGQGFSIMEKCRKEVAEAIADSVAREVKGINDYDEAIRQSKWEELKVLGKIGLRYDSHNKELVEFASKVDEMTQKSAADLQKSIEDRKWPGNDAKFSGPGTPDELCKAAVDYFNSTCKPNEKALAACIVEPDWYCFKKNVFGDPVQWGLTFWVAVELKDEKDPSLVQIWGISFLTAEERGVQKAPPFKLAAFGFGTKMKKANVPGLK